MSRALSWARDSFISWWNWLQLKEENEERHSAGKEVDRLADEIKKVLREGGEVSPEMEKQLQEARDRFLRNNSPFGLH